MRVFHSLFLGVYRLVKNTSDDPVFYSSSAVFISQTIYSGLVFSIVKFFFFPEENPIQFGSTFSFKLFLLPILSGHVIIINYYYNRLIQKGRLSLEVEISRWQSIKSIMIYIVLPLVIGIFISKNYT